MQLLFLRPILEDFLSIKSDKCMIDRYCIDHKSVEKVYRSRYNITDINTVVADSLDILSSIGCVPFMIGSEDDCNKFEKSIDEALTKFNQTDVLWVSPRIVNGDVMGVYNIASCTVYMVNGKLFQHAICVNDDLGKFARCDIRLFNKLSNSILFEDLCSTKEVKNVSKTLVSILDTMQYNTIEVVLDSLYGNYDLHLDNHHWFICKIGGKPQLFKSFDDFLYKYAYSCIGCNVERDFLELIAYGNDEYARGTWKILNGVKHVINSEMDMIYFVCNAYDKDILYLDRLED